MCNPKFSPFWPNFILGKQLEQKQYPANIWVEYDHTKNGYTFMGFFESCEDDEVSEKISAERISYFMQLRGEILAQRIDKSLLHKNMLLINSAIELLGYPAQIGFLNRGRCAIKLVSTFSQKKIPNVAKFCRQHFPSDTLGPFTKGTMLEQLLEALSTSNIQPRISIDLDLDRGRLGNRLCLEEENTSHRAQQKNYSANRSSDQMIPSRIFDFTNYFDNYQNSKDLEYILPYAEKRPSSNLVGNEVICIRHSHRKFTISKDRANVKDYIHVTCGRVDS